jgi:hypothetical protein
MKNLKLKSLQIEPKSNQKQWYRSGSTIEKIINLIDEGFFNENRTIKDIIIKLKSLDYHFAPKDLTLPLRTLVRKGLLRKTKDLQNGVKSGRWTYVKAHG